MITKLKDYCGYQILKEEHNIGTDAYKKWYEAHAYGSTVHKCESLTSLKAYLKLI